MIMLTGSRALSRLFLAALPLLASCAAHRGAVSSRNAPERPVCSSIPFSNREAPVSWVRTQRPDSLYISRAVTASLACYRLDTPALMRNLAMLASAPEPASFSVPLPAPLGCQYFQMRPAGDAARKDVFEGVSLYNTSATIRMTVSDRMQAEILWDSVRYAITPIAGRPAEYAVYEQTPPPAPALPAGFDKKRLLRPSDVRRVYRALNTEK